MNVEMGKNKITSLQFLLLALLNVCAVDGEKCPSDPDNIPDTDLTCNTDYDRTIICVWDSKKNNPDNVCKLHAKYESKYINYDASCQLMKPADASRSTLQKCSLIFNRERRFQSDHNLSITLTCSPEEQSLKFFFHPASQIKLNPPPQPSIINSTLVSWIPQVKFNNRIPKYITQLQWKLESEPWRDAGCKSCEWDCMMSLNDDQLIQGGKYEARIRVKTDPDYKSIWSEWSPSVSWVSLEGKPPPDPPRGVLVAAAVAVAFVLFGIFIGYKKNKTWVYIVKRIRGRPLPNPEKSFLDFETWLSPYFTGESFHSLLKPLDIASVELSSAVDAVAPCGLEAALLEKKRSERSCSSSNFSNPSYSQLCPLPPVSSLAAGNLAPCATDTPYGPVGSQVEGKNPEEGKVEARGKEVEIHQLLSGGSDNNSEHISVVSDYEKVEKPQVERIRLQSLDSGVCSGEEVSQESLEGDSINMTEDHDVRTEGEEEREGGDGKEVDVQKLLGGSGGGFDKGSMTVCFGYERVQSPQTDSHTLSSLDSGMSSGGEEQVSQEESLEDADKSTESTSLLCPPSSPSPCSLPSFIPPPLNPSGPGSSPGLQPLPSHLLERIALMSTSRSVEPSGDGYMPARQEQKN